MRIGLYTNINRDIDCKITNKLIEQIKKIQGAEYKLLAVDGKHNLKDEKKEQESLISNIDYLITIGGDGTTLSTVINAATANIPILGVNAGNLGFLTEINEEDKIFHKLIEKLYNKDFKIEKRTMIEATSDCFEGSFFALNEILVCKNAHSHVAKLKIFIDGILADDFTGDGVMVATPTGSTAYSLSCSGPILSTDVDALVINSICPHILHGRPLVVCDRSTITLETTSQEKDINIIHDGNLFNTHSSKISINIRKAKISAKFIKLHETNFYNTLLKKLNYGKI